MKLKGKRKMKWRRPTELPRRRTRRVGDERRSERTERKVQIDPCMLPTDSQTQFFKVTWILCAFSEVEF